MSKGFEGLMMKAWRADNYTLTVTSVRSITDKYIRVGFTAGGLLADHPVHPTQWIRLWFDDGQGNFRQRGYTLIDQDPENDTFDIEFALHYGPASVWAENAEVGDVLEASVMAKGVGASRFEVPHPAPAEFLVFGDTASLPAVNSLLTALGDIPARVWLEWQYESDPGLPVHAGAAHEVTWLQRVDDGRLMREQAERITCPEGAFAWVACDGRTTRSIVKTFKAGHRLPRESIKYQAYWK
ncbi:siderophore-interacting protein [Nocardia sp. NPDC019395]|uniref:siderophore-interacting protein n=1 Tax=Nocardia sp. NPDC019395 TaxID=3154686 RepID=UPI0033F10C9C